MGVHSMMGIAVALGSHRSVHSSTVARSFFVVLLRWFVVFLVVVLCDGISGGGSVLCGTMVILRLVVRCSVGGHGLVI